MKVFVAFCLLVWILPDISQASDRTEKVAILEFQNRANHIITVNRWTMAEDLAKHLRKINQEFETVKRKDVLNALKDLTWDGNRLIHSQEETIARLGVRYLIYGTIEKWRIRGPVVDGYQQQAPEATVVFSFEIVDLSTGKTIGSVTRDGHASGEVGRIDIEDPFDTDETKHEDKLYDATKIALIKSAKEISKILSMPETE